VRVGSSASARLLVFLSEQRFKGGRRNTSTIVEPDGDAPAGGVNWAEPIYHACNSSRLLHSMLPGIACLQETIATL
jgi:hypothetical protein